MSPYLGTMIDIPKLEKILGFGGIRFKKAADETAVCREAAELLAEGNIIGWVQGRAEFGPRALGNRSILTDPRPADMKDKINKRVKFREVYRPLAPSILHEFGDEYFEDYQESPYMERTLVFRKEVRDKVPAVVHENGTGRLQTVKAEWNPLYHRLIRSFYEKTGIPLVLNTSFNVMGKPIMHSVEDAITVLYTTGLDYLIIGNYILYK
jgi:carbamoyltransferase